MKPITERRFFEQLMRLPYVEEIWLYGSRARGDNHDRSDFDLAIVCPGATRADWHTILGIIDEADTLLHIDCVRFDTIPLDDPFRANILEDKKVLYKKEVVL